MSVTINPFTGEPQLVSAGGSGSDANAFAIIQPDSGTSPTANSVSDTLTVTSSDASISNTGSSVAKSIDLKLSSTLQTAISTNTTAIGTPTSANTVSQIVKRDSSGNFSAGVITATNLTTLGMRSPTSGSLFLNSAIPGSYTGTFNVVIDTNNCSITSGSTNFLLGQGAGTSITTGSQNTIIGVNADNANTNTSTQIGYNSYSGGNANTCIGGSASAGTGVAGVFIGNNTGGNASSGSSNVYLGYSAGNNMTSSGGANIIMGRESGTNYPSTSSNSFMAGSPNYPVANVYFGMGYASASPAVWTLNGVGGSGANIAGGDLAIAGGKGTGTGAGGSILFKTAAAGSTGSTLNSLATALSIDSTGAVNLPNQTASKVLATDASKNIVSTGIDSATLTAAFDPTQGSVFFDDFISTGSAAGLGWSPTVSGTAAATAQSGVLITNARKGIWYVSGGTTATGTASLRQYTQGVVLGGGAFAMQTSINISALSTVADEYIYRWGLGTNITTATDEAQGVWLEYDRLGQGVNWVMCTADNSVRTRTASSTAVAAGAWIKLRIEVNAAGTLATFYVNGSSIGTISTNIPVTSSRPCGEKFMVYNTAYTSVQKFIYMDYHWSQLSFTSAR